MCLELVGARITYIQARDLLYMARACLNEGIM